MLNSVNPRLKTYVLKLAVLWSIIGGGVGRGRDLRKMGTWERWGNERKKKRIIFSHGFASQTLLPCSAPGNFLGISLTTCLTNSPSPAPTTTLINKRKLPQTLPRSLQLPVSRKFGQRTRFLTFLRSSKRSDLHRPPFNPPQLRTCAFTVPSFPPSSLRKGGAHLTPPPLSWSIHSSVALSFHPGPFPLKCHII